MKDQLGHDTVRIHVPDPGVHIVGAFYGAHAGRLFHPQLRFGRVNGLFRPEGGELGGHLPDLLVEGDEFVEEIAGTVGP